MPQRAISTTASPGWGVGSGISSRENVRWEVTRPACMGEVCHPTASQPLGAGTAKRVPVPRSEDYVIALAATALSASMTASSGATRPLTRGHFAA